MDQIAVMKMEREDRHRRTQDLIDEVRKRSGGIKPVELDFDSAMIHANYAMFRLALCRINISVQRSVRKSTGYTLPLVASWLPIPTLANIPK